MNRSEHEFYQQRGKSGRLSGSVIIAACLFHIFALLIFWKLPGILKHKPFVEEVVTVDLVSMPDLDKGSSAGEAKSVAKATEKEVEEQVANPESESEPQDAPEPKTEPEVTPEPKPVELEPEPVQEVKPEIAPEVVADKPESEEVKSVSLTPRKKKVKLVKDTRLEEEKKRLEDEKLKKRIEELRAKAEEKKKAEKRRQEELAARKKLEAEKIRKEKLRKRQEEIARKAAREKKQREEEIARARAFEREALAEAEAARKEYERLKALRTDAVGEGGAGFGEGGVNMVNSTLKKQYAATLLSRVQQYWKLPAGRKWPDNIKTVVEFRVNMDGSISNLKVVQPSGDPVYDRFAIATIRKASPLPPIPPALGSETLDFSLGFDPRGVK